MSAQNIAEGYGAIGLPNGGPAPGTPMAPGDSDNIMKTKTGGRRRSMKKVGGTYMEKAGPMGGRRGSRSRSRRSRRSRKVGGGGPMYGFASGPYGAGMPEGQVADGNTASARLPANSVPKGGRRTRKGGKKPQSKWLQHVMTIKNGKGNEGMSLGDAMKAAKETYKK